MIDPTRPRRVGPVDLGQAAARRLPL